MPETEFGFKRSLGLFMLIAIEVGMTIGAGIFVLIGTAIKETGPGVPIAFLIAAIPVMLVMLSLAMISSSIPCVGGTYRYASRFVSPGLAWLGVWGYLIGMVFGAFPLFALRSTEYLLQAFPEIPIENFKAFMKISDIANHLLPNFTPSDFFIQICSALILTFFFLVNYRGVRTAGSAQILMVIILLSAMLYFPIKGFPKIQTEYLSPLFPNGFSGLLLASALLTLALLGSNSAIELGAEIKNPGKNIPLSMAISIPLVTIIYVLIGITAVGVMPWQTLKGELLTKQASFIFSPFGFRFFLLAGAFLAITTSLNALFMCATKSMMIVSDDRLLPKWLCKVHPEYNTPYRFLTIIWLIGLISIFFRVPSGTFESYASIGGLIIFIPLMLAVIRFPGILPQRYASAPFRLKGIWLYLCPSLGMLLSLFAIVILFAGALTSFWRYFFIALLILGEILYLIQKKIIRAKFGDVLKQNIQRDIKNWAQTEQYPTLISSEPDQSQSQNP